MEAVIITIGDEILIGKTVDSNSTWMGGELTRLGIQVKEIISISDEREHILETLDYATQRGQLILITGGLGPTKDDITKKTLAEFFGVGMTTRPELMERLKAYYESRGRTMTAMNKELADLPANAEMLRNDSGTAAGMWFESGEKVYVSMPGVPHEMKGIMEDEVIPRLKEHFDLPVIVYRHVLTAATPESELAGRLEEFEDKLPKHIKLAYLPGIGYVKLRLTAKGDQRAVLEQQLEEKLQELNTYIEKRIYGYDDDVFEAVIGDMLRAHGFTISTAESCTGGYVAHRLTVVPGSSDYFMGSAVTYANHIKEGILGVQHETLEREGAVSEAVVREMLVGVTDRCGTDLGIAISGIAGPGGGTPEKPVGTVWVAVGKPDDMKTNKLSLPFGREQNIQLTAIIVLEMLRKYLKYSIG